MEILIGGHLVTFVGRILDVDGNPYASGTSNTIEIPRPLRVEVGEHSVPRELELDGKGKFALEFFEYHERPLTGLFSVYDFKEYPPATASIMLPHGSTEARIELGDLRLKASPSPVAAEEPTLQGRVVNANGGEPR